MAEDAQLRERLRETLVGVRAKITDARDHKTSLGEAGTKKALIEPVLEALGWDVSDFNEVVLEYKTKRPENPVDYALLLEGKPRLFVEAKALDRAMEDPKLTGQVIGYAAVAGVKWCVLTNGDSYRVYNVHWEEHAERKLFCTARVADPEADAKTVETLLLLSKESFRQGAIDSEWTVHRVDGAVRKALEDLIHGQDKALAKLLAKHAPELSPGQVRESLKRAGVTITFHAPQGPAGGPAHAPMPESGVGEPVGKGEWGPLSFEGPIRRDGEVLILRKHRPFLDTTDEQRTLLQTVRETAEAAYALSKAGAEVSVPAVRKHELGPKGQMPTMRALGALCLAKALHHVRSGHTDYFAIPDNLTAQAMLDRVLAVAEPAPVPTEPGSAVHQAQTFRWTAEISGTGAFTLTCQHRTDASKGFALTGTRVPPDADFGPARHELFEQVYERIKPLFPDLPDGNVRAKAWSGVHKVYPAEVYGNR